MIRPSCTLELSNGHSFKGCLIGSPLESSGELVFTTGMVGYSEALTDPSYFGQILTFTYPLIGNYGIPPLPKSSIDVPRGFESTKVHTSGVIITVDSPEAFHWNSFQSLDTWLKEQGVPGIVGLDTRHLVHEIRANHGLLGKITPEKSQGVRMLGKLNPMDGQDFFDPAQNLILPEVSTAERKILGEGHTKKVAVVDCGIKWNIVRQIVEQGCQVELLPWDTDFNTVECDAWLLSNGPGDPANTGDLKERIIPLLEQEKPILGICLGHQMLCLASGARTVRMPYGHRSHNQPVYLEGTRKGFITTQNHGFVVSDGTLPAGFIPWFRNANDQSIEGVRHEKKPFFSVQFHPESAGGPRDTGWIIQKFVEEIKV